MKKIDIQNLKIGKKELLVILIVLVIAVVSVLIVRNSDSAQKSNRSSQSFMALDEYVSVTCYGKNGKDAAKAVKKALVRMDGSDVGQAFESAAQVISEYSVTSAMVTIGESVLCIGKKSDGSLWRVGVKNLGTKDTGASGVLEVSDAAVVSVGDTEKCTSVTVVSSDSRTAYGMASALILLDPEEAVSLWQTAADTDFEMLYVTKDKIYATNGLKDSYSNDEETVWIEK